jgi:hypothetical protein
MQKKVKLGIVIALVAIMTASVAYAWIASNILTFQTTLAGNPFTLAVVDAYNTKNIELPSQYLPATMYYNEPVALYTITTNLANSAYSNVTTNYEIWRTDGGAMDPTWITVTVEDVNTVSPYTPISTTTLTFSTISDSSISGTANNALSAYIGPYTAPANFVAYATVTVTFNTGAPLTTGGFQAKVWVAVN